MEFTYVVVGAGSIGKRHFDNLKALGKQAELLPWRRFDSLMFDAMLKQKKSRVAVVIATGTRIRFELISRCAEYDVPLYIEKPLAYTRDQLDQIFSIPEELQRRSVVGFMMRYHPIVQKLAEFKLSNPFRSTFTIGHDVNQWRSEWCFSESYASDPEGGGVLLDLCHEIDMACILDPELSVTSVACLEHPTFKGVDVASSISAQGKKVGLCTIQMDYLAPHLVRRGNCEGLHESLEYDFETNTVVVSGIGPKDTKTLPKERNSLFLNLMKDFIGLAEGQDRPFSKQIPRMDLVRGSCDAIVDAWEHRRFVGQIEANLT
ncbi:Inositol 2-dehydrogenase/D-chiro-inositol 3-dehydrogenase [Labrenzia sp. THAF82]|uniref:Gfo/Idh/MocA family protein n=1 Tax=Labrenzia sp. THAF82 TaxID=2587861 RepID=UPI001268CE85|nr:Gfo/Idh/MocA family oxidoreductase [Labrenzia sp. THAF82]QFT32790.1 Inositol 2-dehydrogenase/D-chiro-inositol 3-dehydrogenase [Labrenzia sp. THAF82]